MIYIQVNDRKEVEFIHHMPFDETHGLGKTQEELKQSGLFVESIPEAMDQAGKYPILKYDPVSGLYYDYANRALTDSEKIVELEQNLGNVLLESAADKAKIAEMETSQGDLLMEIATLKMGGSL
ncbi:hypothetical protein [Cytobacillus pseudoceanisediminis]